MLGVPSRRDAHLREHCVQCSRKGGGRALTASGFGRREEARALRQEEAKRQAALIRMRADERRDRLESQAKAAEVPPRPPPPPSHLPPPTTQKIDTGRHRALTPHIAPARRIAAAQGA